MSKYSEDYLQIQIKGIMRSIRMFTLESFFEALEEYRAFTKIHFQAVRRIQKQYGHDDTIMLAIVFYVDDICEGKFFLNYVKYLSAILKADNIQTDNALRYLYTEKLLYDDMQRAAAATAQARLD